MPDAPRVQELLDELLDRQATPEDVCGTCPELLPVVRERWRQISRVRAELDALLPPGGYEAVPAFPPEGPPLPVVAGYDVEAVIGHGGMGVVFRARHLRLNRLVALKMALADIYAGPHERERFRREAEAIAALRHPNVVQIYDVGDADGRAYFTMELMDGGSLAQKLAGMPQPARQAAALLATLADAVHAAHQAGVVHRDLKPANVLLTADGTPKISDFGVARRLDGPTGLTGTGIAVGTPSYMAPEQVVGPTSAVGPAADVYALGAILYELLTGRPPFRGVSPLETLEYVSTTEPVPPSRLVPMVPRDAETITLKCLQKEPARRYETAAALADDLRRFLADEPIFARRVRWTEHAWRSCRRWYRRNKAVARAMFGVFLLLAAGTALASYLALRAAREGEDARAARASLIQRLRRDHTLTLAELVAIHAKLDPLIVSADPQDKGQLLGLRGHMNGRRGNWAQAAEDFAAAIQITPEDHVNFYREAVLRAWLRDRDGYGRLCHEMLDRFGRDEDPIVNERVSKACLLLPRPARELEPAFRLIDEANMRAENHWVRPWIEATQSLAHYRRKRDNDALSLADHSLSSGGNDWNRTVVAQVVRALALRRLGRGEDARQAVQSARQTLSQVKGVGGGDFADSWHDYLISQILLGEVADSFGDAAEGRP